MLLLRGHSGSIFVNRMLLSILCLSTTLLTRLQPLCPVNYDSCILISSMVESPRLESDRVATGLRQSPTFSGRSGPPVLMPSTPQPQHNALGNLLDDEDEYVIIDGPSPFNSTHGSLCAPSDPVAGPFRLMQNALIVQWIIVS